MVVVVHRRPLTDFSRAKFIVKNIDVDLEMDCSSRNDTIFTEQYDDSIKMLVYLSLFESALTLCQN